MEMSTSLNQNARNFGLAWTRPELDQNRGQKGLGDNLKNSLERNREEASESESTTEPLLDQRPRLSNKQKMINAVILAVPVILFIAITSFLTVHFTRSRRTNFLLEDHFSHKRAKKSKKSSKKTKFKLERSWVSDKYWGEKKPIRGFTPPFLPNAMFGCPILAFTKTCLTSENQQKRSRFSHGDQVSVIIKANNYKYLFTSATVGPKGEEILPIYLNGLDVNSIGFEISDYSICFIGFRDKNIPSRCAKLKVGNFEKSLLGVISNTITLDLKFGKEDWEQGTERCSKFGRAEIFHFDSL